MVTGPGDHAEEDNHINQIFHINQALGLSLRIGLLLKSILNLTPISPQIYKGDPRSRMASLSMGLKLGVFGFFSTTHTQKQTQNKCVHDLRAPCGVLRVFIFTLRGQ